MEPQLLVTYQPIQPQLADSGGWRVVAEDALCLAVRMLSQSLDCSNVFEILSEP